MLIGIPREIKNCENRVAITPAGVHDLCLAGHTVLMEESAGLGSSFRDEEFEECGATLVPLAETVWEEADLILKVKEPLPEEYAFFRQDLIIFTFLHLASAPELTQMLLDKKVTAIAYETIQAKNGSLPLLTPMSEVAGKMSVQIGAQFLSRPNGGKGVLLGGVPGVFPGEVVIIGGGVVGVNAAKVALGLGAKVTLLDINLDRLRALDDLFAGRMHTVKSNALNIATAVKKADLLVGAVLIPGYKAPRLVTEDMVKQMQPGSVIVDVAIDQGGSIETIDRVTTHSDPIYIKHGVSHYSVANMPGAVPRTSTIALTNATMPYVLQIANKGLHAALAQDNTLARGVNIMHGEVTCEPVAQSLGYNYRQLEDVVAIISGVSAKIIPDKGHQSIGYSGDPLVNR